MIAAGDLVTIVFGGLGGFAAVVVAINTVLLRRDARQQKVVEQAGVNRMDTFEISQKSLENALARADLENERLTKRIVAIQDEFAAARLGWQRESERQEDEMLVLQSQVAVLQAQVKELSKNVKP